MPKDASSSSSRRSATRKHAAPYGGVRRSARLNRPRSAPLRPPPVVTTDEESNGATMLVDMSSVVPQSVAEEHQPSNLLVVNSAGRTLGSVALNPSATAVIAVTPTNSTTRQPNVVIQQSSTMPPPSTIDVQHFHSYALPQYSYNVAAVPSQLAAHAAAQFTLQQAFGERSAAPTPQQPPRSTTFNEQQLRHQQWARSLRLMAEPAVVQPAPPPPPPPTVTATPTVLYNQILHDLHTMRESMTHAMIQTEAQLSTLSHLVTNLQAQTGVAWPTFLTSLNFGAVSGQPATGRAGTSSGTASLLFAPGEVSGSQARSPYTFSARNVPDSTATTASSRASTSSTSRVTSNIIEFEPGDITFHQILLRDVVNFASLYDDGPGGVDQSTIDSRSMIVQYALDDGDTDCAQCTICRDEYEASVRRLMCTHIFHIACIDRWLNMNRTCPMCRKAVDAATPTTATNVIRM